MGRDIEIRNLRKTFTTDDGVVTAVDDLSLTIKAGQSLALLGPSGCGKTTTLRCIAGLEHADSGMIKIGDQVVFDSSGGKVIPPEGRNLGMVFQSYALWPHMSVLKNVGYPLRLRRVPRHERRTRVERALAQVNCSELIERFPGELSGGQQQRIALARAIVTEPSVLLLDEPLSNLDANLREHLRFELMRLARRLELTAIYVTHDQAEALTVAEHIVVMRAGSVSQEGPSSVVYGEPSNFFVSRFMGNNNVLGVQDVRRDPDGTFAVTLNGMTVRVPSVIADSALPEFADHEAVLTFRSQKTRIRTGGGPSQWPTVKGRISEQVFLGDSLSYFVSVADQEIRIDQSGPEPVAEPGDVVEVEIDPAGMRAFVRPDGTSRPGSPTPTPGSAK